MIKPLLALALIVSLGIVGRASAGPSVLPRSAPEAQGISSAALLALVSDADREFTNLNSIMIVRHGQVVAEGWWAPYGADDPHMLLSLTKSFTSTAVGLAAAEGRLSLDDQVLKFFPEEAPAHPSDNLKILRIRDLLMMSTGQRGEDLTKVDFYKTESIPKLFFSVPVAEKPGTLFYYNSMGSYMLSAIVQKATGETTLNYLRPRLFEPLGITNPFWDISPEGVSWGPSGLRLRTEEIARFGQLYLQRGEWNGQRLLPAAWVDLATSRQTSNGSEPTSDFDQGYGYQFWRCQPGFYRADGAFGEFCIVMPQYDTVVAITSGNDEQKARVMSFLWSRLLPELRPVALPADEAAVAALKRELSSLTLPTESGSPTSPIAAEISGGVYRFAANSLGLETIEPQFGADGATLLVRVSGQVVKVNAGYGAWKKDGRFPKGGSLEARWLEPGIEAVAGSGAWTTDDTYTARLVFYQTPNNFDLKLRFAAGQIYLDEVIPTGKNLQRLPELIGKLE